MDIITQNRIAYEAASDEYEKHYFDNQTGGYVLIHQGHNRGESFASEVFIAETLARQGAIVVLVDERGEDGVRRFDALVDGEVWEFKELTENAKSVSSAIQKGLREGKKQASRVAYHINRDADIKQINLAVKNALYWDTSGKIQVIIIVDRNGSFQSLSREEIDNGKYFG